MESIVNDPEASEELKERRQEIINQMEIYPDKSIYDIVDEMHHSEGYDSPTKSFKTRHINDPELLTAHELAMILQSMPDHFVQIMTRSGFETIKSIGTGETIYNPNPLEESGSKVHH